MAPVPLYSFVHLIFGQILMNYPILTSAENIIIVAGLAGSYMAYAMGKKGRVRYLRKD